MRNFIIFMLFSVIFITLNGFTENKEVKNNNLSGQKRDIILPPSGTDIEHIKDRLKKMVTEVEDELEQVRNLKSSHSPAPVRSDAIPHYELGLRYVANEWYYRAEEELKKALNKCDNDILERQIRKYLDICRKEIEIMENI